MRIRSMMISGAQQRTVRLACVRCSEEKKNTLSGTDLLEAFSFDMSFVIMYRARCALLNNLKRHRSRRNGWALLRPNCMCKFAILTGTTRVAEVDLDPSWIWCNWHAYISIEVDRNPQSYTHTHITIYVRVDCTIDICAEINLIYNLTRRANGHLRARCALPGSTQWHVHPKNNPFRSTIHIWRNRSGEYDSHLGGVYQEKNLPPASKSP